MISPKGFGLEMTSSDRPCVLNHTMGIDGGHPPWRNARLAVKRSSSGVLSKATCGSATRPASSRDRVSLPRPKCRSTNLRLVRATSITAHARDARGPGPVDVHSSYWVWSTLLMTRWGTSQKLGCRRCAIKSQVGNMLFSGVLGWWGFPWGFIFTPVQVGRNFVAMFTPPDPSQPSPRLLQVARLDVARTG